jgi:hypothetical protein
MKHCQDTGITLSLLQNSLQTWDVRMKVTILEIRKDNGNWGGFMTSVNTGGTKDSNSKPIACTLFYFVSRLVEYSTSTYKSQV